MRAGASFGITRTAIGLGNDVGVIGAYTTAALFGGTIGLYAASAINCADPTTRALFALLGAIPVTKDIWKRFRRRNSPLTPTQLGFALAGFIHFLRTEENPYGGNRFKLDR